MRTLIQGGWVVGFDGHGHELLPDGVVVYEGNRVLYVGHQFEGEVDRRVDARGKLVCPGFINCHIHADIPARHVLFNDATKSDYFGQNFVAYSATVPGAKAPVRRPEVEGLYGVWAAVRGGATTVLDVGTRDTSLEAFTKMLGGLGVRAYVGPIFRSATYALDEEGRIQWRWDEAAGRAGLERARAYIREHHGAHGDRIRGMLYPGQMDTCTLDLLRAAKEAARELGVGMQLHAAMNLPEFHRVLREHQRTPLELLAEIGFLGPEVILGHAVFHAGHSWVHYPYVDDLKILADSGASVAHAPYKYARMGLTLESFDRYRHYGINVALGTDAFPEDLVREMRLAALICRVAEGSFRAGKPRDVFDAATLGGARALRRDDLGRLAPGAKADLLVINLRQLHFGGVRDPIKSLVEGATSQDIETIVIDGETLVEGGRALRVDEEALLSQVQEASERVWAAIPGWRPQGQTLEDVAPMSYPVRGGTSPRE